MCQTLAMFEKKCPRNLGLLLSQVVVCSAFSIFRTNAWLRDGLDESYQCNDTILFIFHSNLSRKKFAVDASLAKHNDVATQFLR